MDEEVTVEPARERGWKRTVRQPKVWIPAAALVAALTVGGSIAAVASGSNPGPSPSVTPTVTAATPSATQSASPSITSPAAPSVSPSPSPSPVDEDWGEDIDARELPACVPNGAVMAAPKQSTQFVEPKPGSQTGSFSDDDLARFGIVGFSADNKRLVLHRYYEGQETVSVRRSSDLKEVGAFASEYEAAEAWDNAHQKLAVATTDSKDRLTVSVVDVSNASATVVYTNEDSTAQSVAWSPDGRCLLLVSRWVGDLRQRWNTEAHTITIIDVATGNSSYLDWGLSAVYSPTGDSIFYYAPDVDDNRVKLFQADAATGESVVRSVGNGSTFDEVAHWPVRFSPNGEVGVYVEYPAQRSSNIKSIAASGEGDRNWATFPKDTARLPVWSRDSKRIAYCTGWYESGCGRLVVADAASGKVLEQADAPNGELFNILWTPDGKSLVAAVYVTKEKSTAIYRLESSTWTRITDPGEGYSGAMAWSYDGATVVWTRNSSVLVDRD